jgi:hypothetical protein
MGKTSENIIQSSGEINQTKNLSVKLAEKSAKLAEKSAKLKKYQPKQQGNQPN